MTEIKECIKQIIGDLTDRRGLDQAWDSIDEDIQQEIKEAWSSMIEPYFICAEKDKRIKELEVETDKIEDLTSEMEIDEFFLSGKDKEIEKLKNNINKLKTALNIYADKDNWSCDGFMWPTMIGRHDILFCNHELAEDALKKGG